MSDDLERDLERAFAPGAGAERRIARAALAARPPRRGRYWVAGAALVLAAALALLPARDDTPPAPADARYRITNESAVITVVSDSGETRLIASRVRPATGGGGIIVDLGGDS